MCLYPCLRYPACKFYLFCAVLCWYLWPLRLHHALPHYLIHSKICGKKLLNMDCVFWFHLHLSEHFLNLRKIQRNIIINLHWYSCKVPVIPVIFSKKIWNMKFYENLSSGSQVVPCGQTDGQTDRHKEANRRLLQYCEGA